MKRFHVLAGLPRAGSTLLANILTQHPEVYVSSTSPLHPSIEAIQGVLSTSLEAQGQLANVPGCYENYLTAIRRFVDGWYSHRTEHVVIDKGRGWVLNKLLLDQLYPDAVMICCVRDPRDVIASIERQHQNTAVFRSPLDRTLYEAASVAMNKDSLVGGPMYYIEDLLRRNALNVVWVRFENLCAEPERVVNHVATQLGLAERTWDFDNVENVAGDLDAVYLNKYPHSGSGQVKPPAHDWRDTLDVDLAAQIASVYPFFMHHFGYSIR